MDKDTIQKAIERRAEEKLQQEYNALREVIVRSPLTAYLKVGGEKVIAFGQNGSDGRYKQMFPYSVRDIDDKDLLEKVQKRREQLIDEETQNLVKKIDSIGYLFEQVAHM